MRNKRLEYVTATVFLAGFISIWGIGFWLHWIHAVMAGVSVLLVGTFPFWLISE